MTTRLFNKVVTRAGPSRSVPAAAARLPAAHFSAVIYSFFACDANADGQHFGIDTLKTYLTHKTLVLAITHLCCEALVVDRALMRATNNSVQILKDLRQACKTGAALVVRQLVSKLSGRPARLTLPCAALNPHVLTIPPLRHAWLRLHAALGVKARIPNWVVDALPNAAKTYQMCLQQPRQLTHTFATKIRLISNEWYKAFELTGAREYLKTITVEDKATLYILVHAYNLRRSLVISLDLNSTSTQHATVCSGCMSLRTQAHNFCVVKSKRSGIMLDVRQREAKCADCYSKSLVRVPIGSRSITVRGSKTDMSNRACGGCGRLSSLANFVGNQPYCKRCMPESVPLQCFCRAPARCTVKHFLAIANHEFVLQGVCNRHVHFLPHSIEQLCVVARRANVRI